jgi:hypothetical protein
MKGTCGHCGKPVDVDANGKAKKHNKTVLTSGGERSIKCTGTGSTALPR